jgi:hypothetical protein
MKLDEIASRILISLLLCISGSVILAQDTATDSLYKVIRQSQNDTVKVQRLLDLSRQLFGSDPTTSISISEEARVLAESLRYQSGLGYAYKNIGIGDYVKG